MLDSMTQNYWREIVKILPSIMQLYNGCHYVTLLNLLTTILA